MGAKIEGVGSSTLRIAGSDRLHGARHAIMPDRIETGTYELAAAITGGTVDLEGARLEGIEAGDEQFRRTGVPTSQRNRSEERREGKTGVGTRGTLGVRH